MKYVKINPAQPKVTVQFLEDKEPKVVQEAKQQTFTVEMQASLFEAFTRWAHIVPCPPTEEEYDAVIECKKICEKELGLKFDTSERTDSMASHLYYVLMQK